MASKLTTGLVGLAVEANGKQKLALLYKRTLEIVGNMPQTAEYRQKTEAVTKHRQTILNKYTDMALVEEHIGNGQIEELIIQAKNEHHLAREMAECRPWETLVGEAPPGQWDWP
ncbi:NADH dehydrogenase [ubiquinone] 1 alpha subcomplex subunit 5-like [Styela clava]